MKKLVQKLNKVEGNSKELIEEFTLIKSIVQLQLPQMYSNIQDLIRANEDQNSLIFNVD